MCIRDRFKLSHSRAFVLRAYWKQSHEMLFDAHNQAFALFGGVPRRGIYDNMKTAVDKVREGKRRDVNAVSYTHLDVYKRQEVGHQCVGGHLVCTDKPAFVASTHVVDLKASFGEVQRGPGGGPQGVDARNNVATHLQSRMQSFLLGQGQVDLGPWAESALDLSLIHI